MIPTCIAHLVMFYFLGRVVRVGSHEDGKIENGILIATAENEFADSGYVVREEHSVNLVNSLDLLGLSRPRQFINDHISHEY